MKSADVIVLSSPTYFYNMAGQLKALIDRTYGHEKDLREKEFFYIATSTDRDKESTDRVFEAFHGFAALSLRVGRAWHNPWQWGA